MLTIPDEALPGLIVDLWVQLRSEVRHGRRPDWVTEQLHLADEITRRLAGHCLTAGISLQGIPLHVSRGRVLGCSPRTRFPQIRAMAVAVLDLVGGDPLRDIVDIGKRSKSGQSIIADYVLRYRKLEVVDDFAEIRGFLNAADDP